MRGFRGKRTYIARRQLKITTNNFDEKQNKIIMMISIVSMLRSVYVHIYIYIYTYPTLLKTINSRGISGVAIGSRA